MDPIFTVIVLHEEHNQTREREGAKEQADPTRDPPPNRAPELGSPPPHISPAPPSTNSLTVKSRIETDPCFELDQIAIKEWLFTHSLTVTCTIEANGYIRIRKLSWERSLLVEKVRARRKIVQMDW